MMMIMMIVMMMMITIDGDDADDDLDVGDDDSDIGDVDETMMIRCCYLLDGFEISCALNPKNIITTTGSAEYIDYMISLTSSMMMLTCIIMKYIANCQIQT